MAQPRLGSAQPFRVRHPRFALHAALPRTSTRPQEYKKGCPLTPLHTLSFILLYHARARLYTLRVSRQQHCPILQFRKGSLFQQRRISPFPESPLAFSIVTKCNPACMIERNNVLRHGLGRFSPHHVKERRFSFSHMPTLLREALIPLCWSVTPHTTSHGPHYDFPILTVLGVYLV
jgi:hypothetical protein